jgi:transcriptional regulator with XRE-family HTH domain
MNEPATRLKQARTGQGMTLDVASDSARISTAYPHKLEAGRVQTPSPHVLGRLASVLGVPYLELLTLAGYLDLPESPGHSENVPHHPHAERSFAMNEPPSSDNPTNAEIVRLLQAVQAELGELRRGQEELARQLGGSLSGESRA